MRILRFWKGGVATLLVVFGLVAYKTTAIEPVLPAGEKQCCSKEMDCPDQKPAISTGTGGSIIWDSFSNNLLSGDI